MTELRLSDYCSEDGLTHVPLCPVERHPDLAERSGHADVGTAIEDSMSRPVNPPPTLLLTETLTGWLTQARGRDKSGLTA